MLALLGGVALTRSAAVPPAPARPPAPPVSMQEVVASLTAPALGGRALGTPGEAAAATYVAARFEALGLPPLPGEPRLQTFEGTLDGGPFRSAGNVVAFLDVGARDTVLLGAHYDHLGDGGPLSRDRFERGLHPGADDNASGVAVLLELAARFARGAPRPPVNVLFVAWAGEEEGLLGAQAFLARHPPATLRLRAAFNFEMVGRMDAARPLVGVEGVVEFPELGALLDRVPPPPFTVQREPGITEGGSDHWALARAGVPALSFTTGTTTDYHRRTDTAERLDYAGMEKLAAWVVALVEAVGSSPG